MKLNACTKTMNGIFISFRYLAIICVGIQLIGCSATIRNHVSVPDDNIQGSNIRGGDIIDFKWPDIDLSIQVQNHLSHFGFVQLLFVPIIPVWSSKEKAQEGPYLTIWVNIIPKDNTFSFDPGRIILKFDDGSNVQVKKFIGPLESWSSARTVQEGCGKRRYSLGVATSRTVVYEEDLQTPQGPIPIPFETNLKGSCFLLGFSTNNSPERNFVLSIEGINKGSEQYTVPEIRFSKGAVWDMFPVP